MNVGDVVMIYCDPITRTKEEGRAKLLKCVDDDPELPRWLVRFEGDLDDDGGLHERTIYVGGQ